MTVTFDTSGWLTLKDIAALEAGAPFDVINETIASAVELDIFPAETIPGSAVELSVLRTLPTVGFSEINLGVSASRAEWDTKLWQTKPLTDRVEMDIRGLRGAKDQARILANQTKPHMTALLSQACKAFWYGSLIDAHAPPGIVAQHVADSDHVVDFGGSTAKTSVWVFADVGEAAKFLFGNSQTILMADQWKEETIYDASGGKLPGLTNWIDGRVGAKLENKHAAIRIKNISLTASNGVYTNKFTDTALYSALALLAALGRVPKLIIGHPFVFESLRQSRITALLPNPPAVMDWENVPCVRSINLSIDEGTIGA